MWDNDNILAFVHIEKAAGTSLIHVLRRNFFMRYLDVRPMSTRSNRVFRAADMRQSLQVNPFIRCIAGHSISPVGGLQDAYPQVRFITLLREPVARYVSQYKYWVQALGHELTFEEFLDIPRTHNYQTAKIAGIADLEKAKQSLSNRFFLVGVVERFDEFLLQLQAKMRPRVLDPRYVVHNVGDKRSAPVSQQIDHFGDAIRERNELDRQLYEYVEEQLLPRQTAAFGDGFETALQAFRGARIPGPAAIAKSYLDGFLRKAYYEPVTGAIRRWNKMPATGSY